jgi:hypothetical protein
MQSFKPVRQLILSVRRQNMKPRGILPTYVTDQRVVLCKAAPTIRNTYEIRLALFMAVQSKRTFVLAVSPMAMVDQALEAHIRQHGGEVVRDTIREHSLYVGAIDGDGEEGDGWVAGDSQLWESVLAGLRSPWLRERLRVGGSVSTSELSEFRDALQAETIRASNVDDEDIHQALLRLAAEAMELGGSVFVQ